MGTCLAVASVDLYTSFPAFVFLQVKRQLRPGETIVQCGTEFADDAPTARERLLALLKNDPKPSALILIAVKPGPAVIEAYRAAGAPVVLIDEQAAGASTVAVDNHVMGRLAGEHLVKLGRRSIAVVSGRAGIAASFSAAQRQQGLREALAAAGLALAPENVLEVVEYSHKDGANAMTSLLDRTPRIDGVFCAAGDRAATGMLEVAKARGVRIPEDVAVVSCDNLPLAASSDPPLTTLEQPLEAIAREAHRLATDEHAAILAKPRRVLLPPTLVHRQSA